MFAHCKMLCLVSSLSSRCLSLCIHDTAEWALTADARLVNILYLTYVGLLQQCILAGQHFQQCFLSQTPPLSQIQPLIMVIDSYCLLLTGNTCQEGPGVRRVYRKGYPTCPAYPLLILLWPLLPHLPSRLAGPSSQLRSCPQPQSLWTTSSYPLRYCLPQAVVLHRATASARWCCSRPVATSWLSKMCVCFGWQHRRVVSNLLPAELSHCGREITASPNTCAS